MVREAKGRVAAPARSHMNGSLPFEKTIEQRTGTMPLALNKSNWCSKGQVELEAYESYYTKSGWVLPPPPPASTPPPPKKKNEEE